MRKAILVLTLFLNGCGIPWEPIPPLTTMQRSMDGVKMIDRNDQRSDEPSHYGQYTYHLNETRRLLLRFEAFTEEVDNINVENGKKVWVEVTAVSDHDVAASLDGLRLCPLTREWMMLANWSCGHPFGHEGKWQLEGGDIDFSGCMRPEVKEGTTMKFDATKWFISYPRGRGENYGFILVTDEHLTLYGEKSGSFAPRFQFDSYSI